MEYSGSRYDGPQESGRAEGVGTYVFPNGTRYVGGFKNGMFDGEGTMYVPGCGAYTAQWSEGRKVAGSYTFADGLAYEQGENWDYCTPGDRRFRTERQSGIRPAGEDQLTNNIGGGVDPWRARRVTVDFWSLDVEGLELYVLDALDVSRVHIRSLLVEDFWQPNRQLDYLLARKGFVKAHQMAADSLYVSASDASMLLPPDGKWWYPKGFHRQWEANTKWRRHVKRTEPYRFPEDLRL